MQRVLEGIRVLDFGRFVAGPYCATILADFGADVIRIEKPGGGEDRTLVPVTEQGEGSLFLQMNRNKRSITLDPRHRKAAEIRRRLIASADVVVVNVPNVALHGMGLDYETLCAIRADIILANISSFGTTGPWKDRGGFDSVGQAMCGSVYLSGERERHYRTPITWIDHATGLYAAIGVMMALWERRRSGKGQQVDASLLGAGLAFSTTYLMEQALTKIGRTSIGNRSFINGPTDSFACTDGWIVTQVVGNPLFKRWTQLIGEQQWLDDARFTTDELRGINGEVLSERMSRWCAERTSVDALDALCAAGIPAGPVLSPQQVLDHPQVHGMGLFQEVTYPGLSRAAPLTRVPIVLSDTPADIRRRPPTVGEHNGEVLAGLGYSAAEIAEFAREAVC